MPNNEADLGRYARQIEAAWIELQGRAVVLSPRDWDRVEDWFQRGVPLPLILETIAEARHRLRGVPRPPSRLSYIADGVEDSWAAMVDGRRRAESLSADTAPQPVRWRERWQRRLDEEPTKPDVRQRIEKNLSCTPENADESVFRRGLAEDLAALLESRELETLEENANQRLEPHRQRLSAGEFRKQKIRERNEALLRHFGL